MNDLNNVNNDAKKPLDLLPSSFKFHKLTTEAGEVRLHCHLIKMKDSLYIWIGDAKNPIMDDLSLALFSRYDKNVPSSTKLLGPISDGNSMSLAKRLSKKIGKPVFVSFNVNVDNLSLPAIEKRLHEDFAKIPEFFQF